MAGKETKGSREREKRLEELQRQLDDLKVRAVKVTKISCKGGGLLDSGATHAMKDDRSRLEKTVVTMADGGKREMYITPGKILVCTEKVDPILPLGGLVEKLGCRVEWQGSCCQLWHPVKGRIAVEMVNGCPEVSRREAEELIEEIEEKVSARKVWDIGAKGAVPTETEKKVQCQVEKEWMRSLVENHEVFQGLPEEIKERVLELPATDWSSLPWNRRRRRRYPSGAKRRHGGGRPVRRIAEAVLGGEIRRSRIVQTIRSIPK